MPVYLELLHGRKSPREQLDDWGEDGPILGPLRWVHTTYATDVKCCPHGEVDGIALPVVEDLLHYDGMFYGDWSVIGQDVLDENRKEFKKRLQQVDEAKAEVVAEKVARRVEGPNF